MSKAKWGCVECDYTFNACATIKPWMMGCRYWSAFSIRHCPLCRGVGGAKIAQVAA